MKKSIYRTLFYFFQLYERIKNKIRYENYRQNYDIDKGFVFNGPGIQFYGGGEIIAKSNSYIGNYSTIQSDINCKVSIGSGCMISHNVRIYTSTAIVDQDFSLKPLKEKFSNVTIEDNVWIAANVFISPGVVIGSNSIVGANSVVTKDIPANAIYGGVPAKLIRFKNIV